MGEEDRLKIAEEKTLRQNAMAGLLNSLDGIDLDIYGTNVNRWWGFMSRAGAWDKSHLMRQIEKYADVYTSRVSNLLRYTPYGCFSSSFSQSLAHDEVLSSYLQRLEG